MAIGKRIRFFRELRGMTQKQLGMLVGFSESTADVRIAQYETGARTPREELTAALARALDVSPQALTAPCIDSGVELMHMLFALEDICGVASTYLWGCHCLWFPEKSTKPEIFKLLDEWRSKQGEMERGEITKAEYDHWRYHFPNQEDSELT